MSSSNVNIEACDATEELLDFIHTGGNKALTEEDEEGIDPLENVEVSLQQSGFLMADHNQRTYKCRECMVIFPNQKLLYYHQQSNHLKKVKPQFVKNRETAKFGSFKCSRCTSQFSTAPSLKSHISRVHLMRKVPTTAKSRIFHPAINTAQKLSRLEIDTSNDDKLDLDSFLREEWEVNQARQCALCQVRFTTKQTMKNHYQRAHFRLFKDLPTYSCTKCDFETGYETSFQHHRGAVNDCKEGMSCVKCDQCDQMFTSLKQMGPHQRENHVGKLIAAESSQFSDMKLDLPIPPCLLNVKPDLIEISSDDDFQ